jgi:hypothetical protein
LAKTWFGYELQRRHPELCVPVCHPGVIDSGLTVVPTGFNTIKSALLARPEDGDFFVLTCFLHIYLGFVFFLIFFCLRRADSRAYRLPDDQVSTAGTPRGP